MPFARPAAETPREAHVRQAVGKAIRALRKHAELSQEGLALQAGIGRSYMGRLERGEALPGILVIYKFLPHLNVRFSRFAAEVERQLNALS